VKAVDRGQNNRGVETRAKMLDAAVGCLVDGGIEAVRIATVARLVGVSTAAVHYHFSTREELLTEALDTSFQIPEDARTSTQYGTGDALQRLKHKLEQSLPFPGPRQREWELWVELWHRAIREPALRATAAAVYERLHWSLRELLDEGNEANLWHVEDPGRLTDQMLALIDGYGLRALLGDPRLSVETAFEHLWAATLAALDVDEASRPSEPTTR
jgi:AcrR family transcriptional regulator